MKPLPLGYETAFYYTMLQCYELGYIADGAYGIIWLVVLDEVYMVDMKGCC